MSETSTTFEFKTEAKQLLDMMIHSVYSHKEIFLRELISNASDAIDKLKFEALTRDDWRKFAENPQIRLEADKEKKTLTIEDSGIGMNREELVEYIGTIAKSGTKEFLKMLKDAKETQGKNLPPELIGQFGVGFYSCFMVADKVSIVTRRAGEEKAWKWESAGDGTYTISDADRGAPGTSVTLHLKPAEKDAEDEEDFSSEWTLKQIVRKYSDFVSYPIKMRTEKTEYEREPDGKVKEGAQAKTVIEDETLNSMKAIWTRSEKDVTEAEYKEFYKHISHDWNEPMKWITYRAEGAMNEFRALVYLPTKASNDLFMDESQRGIRLYIKRVFIMNDCKELIPEYLRFVRGVVDSEDLSLNISREILQKNRQIENIKKSLTKKVLDSLKGLRNDNKEKFLEFWKEFGKVVKEGLFKEPGDRDKLYEVCIFNSTHSATEPTTLEDYVTRMKAEQDTIYYITGESRTALEGTPHLEAFKDKGYEVLLLTDPVDEVWVQMAFEYKGKRFQSAGKGLAKLGSEEERKKEEESMKEKEKECKSLLDFFKARLDEHVKEVRLSSRLTSSAACLVGEASDMSPQLEALLKASGKDVPKIKRILELNPNHPLLEKLKGLYEKDKNDTRLEDFADLLYGQAVLSEGGKLPEGSRFAKKLSDLMLKAL